MTNIDHSKSCDKVLVVNIRYGLTSFFSVDADVRYLLGADTDTDIRGFGKLM